jgi:enabled protein
MSPTSPAPFVRLGGAIAVSDVPVVRELKGQVPSVVPAAMDSRAGLRRTSGPRKVPPPVPERMGVDPKLQALLAKQRAWEPEDEDEKSKKTVTPPRSPSGGPEPTARRLSPSEFDTKRKTGWKKEEA